MVQTKIIHKGTGTPLFKKNNGEFLVEIIHSNQARNFSLSELHIDEHQNAYAPAFDKNGGWFPPAPVHPNEECREC